MTNRTDPSFEFIDDTTGFRAPGALVVRLAGRLRRKQDLFRALADGLKFPPYFGWNWDALEECLCNLSWLRERTNIVLVHKHIPLASVEQRSIYLDILRNARAQQPARLRIVFPKTAQAVLQKHTSR